MTVSTPVSPIFGSMQKTQTDSQQPRRPQSLAAMKLWQAARIREIANALTASGFYTLDEQARALGVSRSTAWSILKSAHKSSGLSAEIINRMLAKSQLPPLVRSKILEYVEEKIAGRYGHTEKLRRKFIAALSADAQPARLQIVKVSRSGESDADDSASITPRMRLKSIVRKSRGANTSRKLLRGAS